MQRALRSPSFLIDHFCPLVLRQGGCQRPEAAGPHPSASRPAEILGLVVSDAAEGIGVLWGSCCLLVTKAS